MDRGRPAMPPLSDTLLSGAGAGRSGETGCERIPQRAKTLMDWLQDDRGEFDILLTRLASGCLSLAFLCYPAAFDSASGFAAWGPPLTKETNGDVSRPSRPYRLRPGVACAAYKS
jgi:hypothetical protein